jgi:hypothetical protein
MLDGLPFIPPFLGRSLNKHREHYTDSVLGVRMDTVQDDPTSYADSSGIHCILGALHHLTSKESHKPLLD